MDQIQIQREMLAYAEKVALAKLEVKKAEERVAELEYEQSRFQLEMFIHSQKQQSDSPEGIDNAR